MQIETRCGFLLGVVGVARRSGGFWFVPACGEIEDPEEVPSHPLRDHSRIEFACDGVESYDSDGVWVRAALPSVFRYAPLHVADGRWCLLDALFVVVAALPQGEDRWIAYPFACTDICGATGLIFSRRAPDPDLRNRIARAFWGLLVAEGDDHLSPFTADRIGFDTGDGYDTELTVGYSRGRFFAEDMSSPGET